MSESLTIYYDGLCPLCSREIDHYRKVDTNHKINYVDIANPDFDAAAEGLNPDDVQNVFHVKTQDGQILTKVDAFVAIWETLDIFSPLATLSKSKMARPLMDFGYMTFAKLRPFLPKKQNCDTGRCAI